MYYYYYYFAHSELLNCPKCSSEMSGSRSTGGREFQDDGPDVYYYLTISNHSQLQSGNAEYIDRVDDSLVSARGADAAMNYMPSLHDINHCLPVCLSVRPSVSRDLTLCRKA